MNHSLYMAEKVSGEAEDAGITFERKSESEIEAFHDGVLIGSAVRKSGRWENWETIIIPERLDQEASDDAAEDNAQRRKSRAEAMMLIVSKWNGYQGRKEIEAERRDSPEVSEERILKMRGDIVEVMQSPERSKKVAEEIRGLAEETGSDSVQSTLRELADLIESGSGAA